MQFALKDAARKLVDEAESGLKDSWGYVTIAVPEQIGCRGRLR